MSTIAIILGLLSPVLVLTGWKVVFFNARRIATRSESKSIVDALSKLINDISDEMVNYWVPGTSEVEPQKYTLVMLAKSSQLQHYINVLLSRGFKIDIGILSKISEDAALDSEYVMAMTEPERLLRAQIGVESCMQGLRHIFSEFSSLYPPEKDVEMYEFFAWVDEDYSNHKVNKKYVASPESAT